jgi:hypothetical protein
MSKKAHDPISVAILLFTLLFVTLMLFLLTAVVQKKAAEKSRPFVPPGWTNPTYPPPSAN